MITLMIEGMLALLLITCIIYSLRLEKRMRVFQSANDTLAQSVAQLSHQTKEADEALRRFRTAVAEANEQLSEPLSTAQNVAHKLNEQIDDAEAVIKKIGRIVGAASPAPQPTPAPRRRAHEVTEARTRSRFAGIG